MEFMDELREIMRDKNGEQIGRALGPYMRISYERGREGLSPKRYYYGGAAYWACQEGKRQYNITLGR